MLSSKPLLRYTADSHFSAGATATKIYKRAGGNFVMVGASHPNCLMTAAGKLVAVNATRINMLPRQNFPDGERITGDDKVTVPPTYDEDGNYTGCGVPVKAFFSGIEWHLRVESCDRQGCPICGQKWAAAAGDYLGGLLWSMFETRMTGPIYHSVMSPSQSIPFPGWEKFEQAIHLFLKSLHAGRYELGYSIVQHLSRVKCANCGGDLEDSGQVGPATPLPAACSQCGGHEFWQVYSPHVHLFTNAFIPMKSMVDQKRVVCLQAALGLVYVNVSHDKRKHKPLFYLSREALVGTAKYELGHARYRNTHDVLGGEAENTYQRARPAYRLFGLFNPKRWAKAQDLPQYEEKIVMDAAQNIFYEVSGKVDCEGFIPDRDEGGNPRYVEKNELIWVDMGTEQRLQVRLARVPERTRSFHPVLRLATWADGTKIPYPEDGHTWVSLVQDDTESRYRHKVEKPELNDEMFDILCHRSDWKLYYNTNQSVVPTKI